MKPLQDLTIYDGIEKLGLPDDRQSWTSGVSPVFQALIQERKPHVIIEVGSWKGVSACRMAAFAGEQAVVYCVDTWLGSLEHHLRKDRDYGVPMDRGHPRLYEQFLTNVARCGLQKQIIPIPNTSAIGARLLKHHKISADFVYIDGSHEYADCLADLRDYWPLVRAGGAMLIDDYKVFSGVYAAVTVFAAENSLWNAFDTLDDKQFAVFYKPVSS